MVSKDSTKVLWNSAATVGKAFGPFLGGVLVDALIYYDVYRYDATTCICINIINGFQGE